MTAVVEIFLSVGLLIAGLYLIAYCAVCLYQ